MGIIDLLMLDVATVTQDFEKLALAVLVTNLLVCYGAISRPTFEDVSRALERDGGVESFIREFLQNNRNFKAIHLEREFRYIAPFYGMKFQ